MGWRGDIAVIPNSTPFLPHEGTHDNSPGQRVVTVANDSRLKNVRVALRAWPKVLLTFPDTELHLVGPSLGPSDDLARWAERHSLHKGVIWHGSVSRVEVRRLVASSTALLHPSLEESLGMVLLEAMALGVAIVGGEASGAVPWAVGDAGVLTDVRSPAAIASTVIELLGNPERCRILGEIGKRRAADIFSPRAVARAYEREYMAVLEERRSG